MANQKILDNAPKGATHYSQGINYLALNSSNSWMRYDPNGFANAKWFTANDYKLSYSNKDFRSLADIKRITELELSRKELIEEFAEAECMGDLAKIARNHGYEEQE